MTTSYDYDLFVIGAGSGGVRAARIAAGHGARAGIAEENKFGGTCVNVGCVPKKLMTYLAAYPSHFQDAAGYGWSLGKRTLDWSHFIEKKNTEILRLNEIYEKMLKNSGVQIYKETAEILDKNTVRLGAKTITAERILIATGGKPSLPQNIEGAQSYGLTSDDIFYLPELPQRIAIIGAGYIALEFAGIFKALGSEVHLVFRRGTILNEEFDIDTRTFLQNELSKKGIHMHKDAELAEVKLDNNGYTIQLKSLIKINIDKVLFATGRKPNTKGLGLEKLAIGTDKNGAIIVDENHQTSLSGVYAVGDVTNRINLTPVALGEAHTLADRLFGKKMRHISYDNIPCAIFSDPPLSKVGLTEAQAKALHPDDIDIYKTEFRPMRYILAQRDERTLMKLVVHRSTDKVLGVHMVGPDAPEIIQGFATALVAGATKAEFDQTIGIHPTAAEEFVTMRQKST